MTEEFKKYIKHIAKLTLIIQYIDFKHGTISFILINKAKNLENKKNWRNERANLPIAMHDIIEFLANYTTILIEARKTLPPKEMLQRLLILLVNYQSGNMSESLVNKIREILCISETAMSALSLNSGNSKTLIGLGLMS